jgi:hypothetical protein
MKLTETNLPKAIREARGKKDVFEWDDELPGFGLRIRNGKRTWIFQYKIGERQHRMRLGGPELNCDQARRLAQVQKGEVSKAKLGTVSIRPLRGRRPKPKPSPRRRERL